MPATATTGPRAAKTKTNGDWVSSQMAQAATTGAMLATSGNGACAARCGIVGTVSAPAAG